MNLSRYINLDIDFGHGVLTWTKASGNQGSFVVPPCFDLKKFLHTMYKDKAAIQIDDFTKTKNILMATIINPMTGQIEYLYEIKYSKIEMELQ